MADIDKVNNNSLRSFSNAVGYDLVLLALDSREMRQPADIILKDPADDDPDALWYVHTEAVAYAFVQVVGTFFSDPTTYNATDRCPPASLVTVPALEGDGTETCVALADMVDAADDYSQCDLSTALGARYTLLNSLHLSGWRLVGHEIQACEGTPGTWQVSWTLEAQTDKVIDPTTAQKTRIPSPAIVVDTGLTGRTTST
jgi:hypothetical protein